MRKIKLQMQISVNGYVAGKNGEMDWMTWAWDDSIKNYVSGITRDVDTIVLSRKVAEGFIPHWAALTEGNSEEAEFAKKMTFTKKVVFSKTLTTSPWENTQIAGGDLGAEITKLKSEPGKDIIVYGGAELISGLLKENLLDELHLFINPVAVGMGKTIFNQLETPMKLKLVKSEKFGCGIVLLCYQTK